MLTKKYLYSDLDGTLVQDDKTISPENLEALRRYAAAGGTFGVATGRSDVIARAFLQLLPVGAPVILYNGAGVYDLPTEKYLYQVTLPDSIAQELLRISTRHPGMTAEAYTVDGFRIVCGEGVPDHTRVMGARGQEAAPEGCKSCMKLLFFSGLDGNERLRALERDLRAVPGIDGVDLIYSMPYYLEILPKSASKGAAMRWVAEYLGASLSDFAAIGDYDNDVEMLEAVGLSAAPSNAPERVRVHADVIVADNNHHAGADFVERCLLKEE